MNWAFALPLWHCGMIPAGSMIRYWKNWKNWPWYWELRGEGLAADTISNCDYTVRIPMSHGVDSLNVAAASAVAFWQLGNRGK